MGFVIVPGLKVGKTWVLGCKSELKWVEILVVPTFGPKAQQISIAYWLSQRFTAEAHGNHYYLLPSKCLPAKNCNFGIIFGALSRNLCKSPRGSYWTELFSGSGKSPLAHSGKKGLLARRGLLLKETSVESCSGL